MALAALPGPRALVPASGAGRHVVHSLGAEMRHVSCALLPLSPPTSNPPGLASNEQCPTSGQFLADVFVRQYSRWLALAAQTNS